MNNENLKVLIAAAAGAVGGLLLGMVLWGGDDRKDKLSARLSSISDIVSQLENLNTKEANDLKDQIKNILGSVEEILGKESVHDAGDVDAGDSGETEGKEEKNG